MYRLYVSVRFDASRASVDIAISGACVMSGIAVYPVVGRVPAVVYAAYLTVAPTVLISRDIVFPPFVISCISDTLSNRPLLSLRIQRRDNGRAFDKHRYLRLAYQR